MPRVPPARSGDSSPFWSRWSFETYRTRPGGPHDVPKNPAQGTILSARRRKLSAWLPAQRPRRVGDPHAAGRAVTLRVVKIDADLARRLVDSQLPEFSHLPIEPVEH